MSDMPHLNHLLFFAAGAYYLVASHQELRPFDWATYSEAPKVRSCL
jgi:hypothetical protein